MKYISPKFEFNYSKALFNDFNAMGMILAFDNHADFSKMTSQSDLYISQIYHKAFVKVDEKGTEAVAATAGVMTDTSTGEPNPKTIFKADHPFIFLIKENSTGIILFMGRVTNPSS